MRAAAAGQAIVFVVVVVVGVVVLVKFMQSESWRKPVYARLKSDLLVLRQR